MIWSGSCVPGQQIGHFTGLGGQGGWGLMTGKTDKSVSVAAPAFPTFPTLHKGNLITSYHHKQNMLKAIFRLLRSSLSRNLRIDDLNLCWECVHVLASLMPLQPVNRCECYELWQIWPRV